MAGQWAGREEALWRKMAGKYSAELVERPRVLWAALMREAEEEEEGEEE